MSVPEFPTVFQKKVCWYSVTALAAMVFVGVLLLACWGIAKAFSYLTPVLTPIAIASVLAYLLTPVVAILCRWKIHRTLSVAIVFAIFIIALALIGITVAPSIEHQGNILMNSIPVYSQQIGILAKQSAAQIQQFANLPPSSVPVHTLPLEEITPAIIKHYGIEIITHSLAWFQEKLPTFASATGAFLQKSIGGVFGILGFLLNLVLVPIFLFFFLLESPSIASQWSRYIPLRASPFKDEIVSLFNEINDYLIHFFRGQLLVSLIDGTIVGLSLFFFLHLNFSFLIGLSLGILCLIPYLGMVLCLIPAMLIALAQYGDIIHPIWVLVIFLIANNFDGIFISPKIIGNSVGLHTMTIIVSVFSWSIILGWTLGSLLAVPLTATMKVLLRRYFWDRSLFLLHENQSMQSVKRQSGFFNKSFMKK